jgi:hypothetical protein
LLASDACPIEGRWKSNEEKTLDNMRRANLTDRQWEILGNGFFGRLVLDMDCKGFISYFDGEVSEVSFEKVVVRGNRVTASYYDLDREKEICRTVVIEQNCYSMKLPGLNFSEVFCRVE